MSGNDERPKKLRPQMIKYVPARSEIRYRKGDIILSVLLIMLSLYIATYTWYELAIIFSTLAIIIGLNSSQYIYFTSYWEDENEMRIYPIKGGFSYERE